MDIFVEARAEKFNIQRKKRLRWYRVFAALIAVVVFVTTYVLIIPASTWSRTLICELPEHTHSADCYVDGSLSCGMEEHTHTDSCFDVTPAKEPEFNCGMTEHQHDESCYFSDGTLRCTLPEHKHSYACYNTPALSATSMLMSATPKTATYYQRVDKIDSTTADYIIVSVEGNYALSAGNSGATSAAGTALKLVPVKGNPGYYTVANVTSSMLWRFGNTVSSSGGTTTIRRGTSGIYLYQTRTGSLGNYSYPLFNSSGRNENLSYNSTNGVWTIRGTASNVTNYYLYANNGNFTSSNSSSNTYYRNMIILKQVNTTLDIPDDIASPDDSGEGGSSDEKVRPTYRADATAISGAKSGNVNDAASIVEGADSGILATYASDPSTTNIEDKFDGIATSAFSPMVNDGKVITDKSVIYMHDDYNAFRAYEDGTFGVTLSALGQDYQLKVEDQVPIPVDVVFVLDVSGSMSNMAGNVTRREAVVSAVNTAMRQIMNDNPENRAGVVVYSSGGSVLLGLDHYTAGNNGNYLRYDRGGDIYTATNLSGKKVGTVASTNGESNGFTQGNGTYTQYGIALGAKLLQDNTDTTYTATLYKNTDYERSIEVNRQPVIILLSDGDPTHCTSNYTDVLNGPTYGSGSYPSTTNNKGIQGYYTVMSANYYKNIVGIHYDTPSIFYTIGMGIYATGYADMSGKSSTGDCYKRAVLNPTSANIADLLSNGARTTNPNSSYTAANTWSITCQMYSQLLNNGYSSSTVTVGSSTSYSTAIGVTNALVPVLENPYTNYNYADGAYFGNLDTKALEEAFSEIITHSQNVKNYGFMLFKGTPVVITDELGEGMEIKGNPVLRYNGINYPLSVKSSSGGVVTYVCNATAVTTDGSGVNGSQRSSDLSLISITVKTINGKQTVTLSVPENALPSYTPDATADWYYEQLPVRLIYQVGLNSAAKQQVLSLKPGQSCEFYTNSWGDTSAYSTQQPHENNPYYNNVTYNNGFSRTKQYRDYQTAKTENTTATAINSVDSHQEMGADQSGQSTYIIQLDLGNNGKLVFVNNNADTAMLTILKTDMLGDPITDSPAFFDLFADADLTQKVGTYYTDSDGKLTIEGLQVDTPYYLTETRAPDGYVRMAVIKTFSVDADGTVKDIAPGDTYLSFEDGNLIVRNPNGKELPSTGGKGGYLFYAIGLLLIIGVLAYGYIRFRGTNR